ncbi:Glycine betaine/proline/ectoine/pipecolic acid transporter OusA [Paraburkholderia sediminicola]|uniref:Glycine betaine/proline/ectoine/pipecolic acid transporter OusA n=1 Tax=Paraburkholderia sediminicola TaxID=458836 RepID=A0A6J5CEX4_9BURK|nr:MFS transporter [Paraburkholderia sediminicola]CAB3733147.1 Glycine betaine/proline/ectoine/pipecolic acid transporter OusA [Paraburkholderia sediminicola]
MSSISATGVRKARLNRSQLIVAATIGNALEFFDFTVYSFFAITIGKVFFPAMSGYGQLLAAVATFGVGFIMRPLGGVMIGAYADRAGRKAAMTLTIFMMALGCGMIGLAPTYAQAGLVAPMLIVAARLIQGFSAGGEVGASTTLLIESGTSTNRAFLGSWQFASQGLGVSIGAFVAWLLSVVLSSSALETWGWRIPFLLGILIAPIGMTIRRRLEEHAPVPATDKRAPAVIVLRDHWNFVLLGTLLTVGSTVAAYVVSFYIPTYAIRELKLSTSTALLAGLVSGLVTFVVAPVAGLLSDRTSRKTLVFWPRLLIVMAVYPAFVWLTRDPGVESLLVTVAGLSALLALQAAPALTMLPEMFPRPVRATGMSIVYSVGVAVFGGFAQVVAIWLIRMTGSKLAPAWYLIVCVLLSCFALPFIKDRTGQELDE